jgi:thymidylate synthase (FAD)
MIKAEYIDHMGDDLRVVNAARVGFYKESDWEDNGIDYTVYDEGKRYELHPILKLSGRDRRLIKYLARHDHWTPFTHCQITFRETVPIFLARQRFRHTVGFVYNEVSRRYVDDEPEFYDPQWRQGSGDKFWPDDQAQIDAEFGAALGTCRVIYENMIDNGVAPEQARAVLPQATMTSYYVTGSLAAWARIYNLRSAPDAQKEWSGLCESWNSTLKELFPVSWAALTEA